MTCLSVRICGRVEGNFGSFFCLAGDANLGPLSENCLNFMQFGQLSILHKTLQIRDSCPKFVKLSAVGRVKTRPFFEPIRFAVGHGVNGCAGWRGAYRVLD